MIQKRILFINSYHEGYPWSTGILKSVEKTLATSKLKDIIVLKAIRMDTKSNISEEFKKAAALKAKAIIQSWQPDIVIASDDNVSKFLILPYFKDKPLPS